MNNLQLLTRLKDLTVKAEDQLRQESTHKTEATLTEINYILALEITRELRKTPHQ
ncbi:MAG: hypothetical protein M1511_15600 [Deltaproteobacteria bacterium]|nr:hypothetical protein [Deltaproteobacteria bacterium]